MPDKLPPPPPADAVLESKPLGKKEAFAMLKEDVNRIKDLADWGVVAIASFVHQVMENKEVPLDEKRITLIRELVEGVFAGTGADLIYTLDEINKVVVKNLKAERPGMDKSKGK